ncbi:formyl transferase [Sporodiniella umbellata]|nr:formyl transferase [Sporodiniella umbellata]
MRAVTNCGYDFASTHLKTLISEKHNAKSCIESLDLVCPPDRYTGRKGATLTPSETKGLAELYNIPIHHTPSKAKTLVNWNLPTDRQYDLGVVVSFGYFIPPHIISQFRLGAVNVHPSLLPSYRGASPIQHTILNGDSQAGVTVQELDDKEFDAGRILAQREMDLGSSAPEYKELKTQLSIIGSKLLVETLKSLDNKKASAVTQDVSKATKAPKINKSWSEVNFKDVEAWKIEQLDRAIGHQFSLRTTYVKKKKRKLRTYTVQLLHVFVPSDPCSLLDESMPPGSWIWHAPTNSIHILCKNQTIIACPTLKLEGRDAILAKDFVNGFDPEGLFGDEPLFSEEDRKKAAKALSAMKPYSNKQ